MLQAELFILRLSRNSGVLGLAGMAFYSQVFSSPLPQFCDPCVHHYVLLLRPLLDLSKDDMYKVSYQSSVFLYQTALVSAHRFLSFREKVCTLLINVLAIITSFSNRFVREEASNGLKTLQTKVNYMRETGFGNHWDSLQVISAFLK